MSARLAALLVKEGLLGQDVITAALGRQVIYGGTLDTALLELRAIDEGALWGALARASGLPVPSSELVESPSPAAAAAWDAFRSHRCQAVPVGLEGRTAKLLCTEPVAREALAEASRELGLDLELYIVPEVRLQAARRAIYRRPMPPRFLALLGRLLGAEPVRRWAAAAHRAGDYDDATETTSPPRNTETAAPTAGHEILHRLAAAQSRDAIFEVLAQAAASRMAFVVVLSVTGQAETRVARGQVARAGTKRDDHRIRQVTLSLALPSPFRNVAETARPYVGSPGTREPVRSFLEAIRRAGIPEVVIVPVVLRDRVIALVYGDRAGAFAFDDDAAELGAFAAAAAKALELVILKSKAEAYSRPQPEHDAAAARLEGGPGPELEGASSWGRPGEGAAREAGRLSEDGGGAGAPAGEKREEVERLLDAFQADPDGPTGGAAGAALVGRGEAAAVLARLSRLVLDGRCSPALESALLRLVVKFGDAALPLVRPLLEHTDAGWRRRAAEMMVTLRPEGSDEALCRLANDPDPGVRPAALRALRRRAGQPPVRALAERLRAVVETASLAQAVVAAGALGELRDAEAVPVLIDKLKAAPAVAMAAHAALVAITKQDFGDSGWRWGSWWKRWRDRDRTEWLLEGLSHRSPEIRYSASDELRHLTGEYFGYHFDLPKPERDQARARWVEWWETTGKARTEKPTREGTS